MVSSFVSERSAMYDDETCIHVLMPLNVSALSLFFVTLSLSSVPASVSTNLLKAAEGNCVVNKMLK